jgi:ankyrin repeat protein
MSHSRRKILIAALGTPLARIAESSTRDGLIDWIRQQRNVQGFERMLRANANPNETDGAGLSALYYAAMARDPAYVRILLKWRADPNFVDPAIRWYPLRGALLAENWQQFQMLLDAGADPRVTDLVGNNLLHIAAQTN